MAVKCQNIIQQIEKIAPKNLAEDWDNVGLMLGDRTKDVKKVLVALDVIPPVVEEALELKADLIISHHPFIFSKLSSIRKDTVIGDMIYKLIQHNVAVYSAHTNMDSAEKGVNFLLSEKLGLQNHVVLQPATKEKLYKLAVFVPVEHADVVKEALGNAGAGWIGNYSHCSFQTKGTGSFKPLEGASPFKGKVGKIEKVQEIKIETIVPKNMLSKVIKNMLKAHPYEEVAYDVFPLENEGKTYGLGRIGYLEEPMNLKSLVEFVKGALKIENVKVVGDLKSTINKVAVCGGSGASTINSAVFKGADVLVTGDIKYHEAQSALWEGLALIDAGHWATEVPIVSCIVEYLASVFKNKDLTIIQSKVYGDPFQWL